MANYVLKKICTQENESFRLYICILDNSVKCVLLKSDTAWESIVTKKDLQHFAEEFKVSFTSYCSKLLDIVKETNSNILYFFKDNNFTINRVLENSLMVRFFYCKVKEVNYVQQVDEIMDKLYSDNTTLKCELDIIKNEKKILTEEKDSCESKLKELVNKKIEEENNHFGQFILILNEKKRQIQHLTELLEAFKAGKQPVKIEYKAPVRKKKETKDIVTSQKKEIISDSDSTETYSDDNQSGSEREDNSSVNTSKFPSPQTSKSTAFKEITDILEDDCDQSHILAKRKRLSNVENEVAIASTSFDPHPKTEQVETSTGRKSPEIDLSTQQLLSLL